MEDKITAEEVKKAWTGSGLGSDPYYLDYLVDILNGDYKVEEAVRDLKSLTRT